MKHLCLGGEKEAECACAMEHREGWETLLNNKMMEKSKQPKCLAKSR